MNPPLLIATAGHVDHGKSSLIQTLTGSDPDRWPEEKARGITIDLGFAHGAWGGRQFSFVDVPGHERFVHNMLAGVGCLDAAMLVVAADESIMPQTKEHALALRHLGIARILVVISKVDLVDEELLELIDLDLDEWLPQQGWSHVQRVHFSTEKPETHQVLKDTLAALPKQETDPQSLFRMAVDRVFTIRGSGTVVTGTVTSGCIECGAQVHFGPGNLSGRIRAIQAHGQAVQRIGSQARAALNLADLHFSELERGHMAFDRSDFATSRRILVRLNRFDPNWKPGPKHHFHLHLLSAHRQARLLWLDDHQTAVLEVDQPLCTRAMDRGLLRDETPLQTVAGFEVLHPQPPSGRRRQLAPMLDTLPPPGDIQAWQTWFVAQQQEPFDIAQLEAQSGRTTFPAVAAGLTQLKGRKAIDSKTWQARCQKVLRILGGLHKAQPMRSTIPTIDLQTRLQQDRWTDSMAEQVLAHLSAQNQLVKTERGLALPDHQPQWSPEAKAALKIVQQHFRHGIAEGQPPAAPLVNQVLRMLKQEGYILSLNEKLMIQGDHYAQLIAQMVATFGERPFSIPELKELLQLTRKTVIPFLEYCDQHGLTRRQENTRILTPLAAQVKAPPFIPPQF